MACEAHGAADVLRDARQRQQRVKGGQQQQRVKAGSSAGAAAALCCTLFASCCYLSRGKATLRENALARRKIIQAGGLKGCSH